MRSVGLLLLTLGLAVTAYACLGPVRASVGPATVECGGAVHAMTSSGLASDIEEACSDVATARVFGGGLAGVALTVGGIVGLLLSLRRDPEVPRLEAHA